jgi:hypothetical protein
MIAGFRIVNDGEQDAGWLAAIIRTEDTSAAHKLRA